VQGIAIVDSGPPTAENPSIKINENLLPPSSRSMLILRLNFLLLVELIGKVISDKQHGAENCHRNPTHH
jgi:hypothetical protein